MLLYIVLGIIVALFSGKIFLFILEFVESWTNTAVAMIAGSLFGLLLLTLRTILGIPFVFMYVNIALGLIAYIFTYYSFYQKTPKRISFFSFLHKRACNAKVTFEEMSTEQTIENLFEISGLAGKKTEAEKILEAPTTGAFDGWFAWIMNLVLYVAVAAGVAELKSVREYFSKIFTAENGEACLSVVVALIIIGLILFFKNKSANPKSKQLMMKTNDRLLECLKANGYTQEQITKELNNLENEIIEQINGEIESKLSAEDFNNWKKFIAMRPSDKDTQKARNQLCKMKMGISFDNLKWQKLREGMEQRIRIEQITSNFRNNLLKKKAG